MNIEDRMTLEAILDQLVEINQRLTNIEENVAAMLPCPKCGGQDYCVCPTTTAPIRPPASPWETQPPLHGSEIWFGLEPLSTSLPWYNPVTAELKVYNPADGTWVLKSPPSFCQCGPHEYCGQCNPEEFKHGPP